ncbi:MAG: recombinase family protein [Clostridia bacterium]
MGRRKRAESPCISDVVTTWETAIYARLSIENSGKNDDGESIDGQVSICREYIDEHPFLHLADTYIDNGWTGTNTDRPEFQRLLDDIRQGKIKALVIKDFSRFSRNYIEAGNLLENIFPTMGVRFISVADRYDSFETDGSAESLLIPLKNLINSYYSKDISKKVSTAMHTKQLVGEYIPSMIPYGYKKSETQAYRFDVDPETAPIVKRIFAEKLSGKGYNEIARGLTNDNIPSPGKLRYLRGQTTRKAYMDSIWSAQGIKQILKNPTYLGDLVFGRMPTALYLGKPDYRYEPDESKWRVLPNMHPALIDKESFEKIKAEMNKSTKDYEKRMSASKKYREKHPPIFSHICCGDCGANLGYTRGRSTKGTYTLSYYCRNPIYNRCKSSHQISQGKLKKIVGTLLSDHIAMFADLDTAVKKMQDTGYTTDKQKTIDREINDIVSRLQKRQSNKEMLYEDYADGLLSAEDYIYHKQKYDDECKELSSRLNTLEVSRKKLNASLSKDNNWLKNIRNLLKTKEVTREIADAFVENIIVYDDNGIRVEVKLKYADELETLIKAIKEMEG